MSIAFPDNVFNSVKDCGLLLDTSVLIDASKSNDFFDLLMKFSKNGSKLIITPSVKYEFTRTAKEKSELKKELELLSALGVAIFDISEYETSEDAQEFLFEYSKSAGKASYTDSQLCLCMKIFQGISPLKLISSNYRDIPLSLFVRESIIAFEEQNEVRTEAIYSIK